MTALIDSESILVIAIPASKF